MKHIPLTREKFAIVDDEDYFSLMQHHWYADPGANTFYAKRYIKNSEGRKSTTKMHREIMGVIGSSLEIDHIDGNGLNNSRSNLRIATRSQNGFNSSPYRSTASRFKGVRWSKEKQRWWASIQCEKVVTFLGYFDFELDAAIAYDEAAKKLHGGFARLNFPLRPYLKE